MICIQDKGKLMRILLITFLQVYITLYFCKINKISFQHGFVGTTIFLVSLQSNEYQAQAN